MEFRFKLVLLIAILLFGAGFSFACSVDTYNDSTYSVAKKMFQKDEVVYLKGTGIGADPKCENESAAKVDYYAPGEIGPAYTHVCTSSNCYLPHEASGTVKDTLELATSDPSGEWTAKVYRGKYSGDTSSCRWEYRGKTTFNVTNFDYSCSISISSPLEESVLLVFQPITAIGRVECGGRPLNPDDFYAQMDWGGGVLSPNLVLNGSIGGSWLFTSAPNNNHYYGESGYEQLTARLYKKAQCEKEEVILCNKSTCYLCGDVNRDGKVGQEDIQYIIDYIFDGGPAPNPLSSGDANGDGQIDISDAVYLVNYVNGNGSGPVCGRSVCGDADKNGLVNQLDAEYLVDYIFHKGPAPSPISSGDADGDGQIDISDAVYLVNYVNGNGSKPMCSWSVCGDADRNGKVGQEDIQYIIDYIFDGGPAPNPLSSGDANGDGQIDISDAVYLVNYFYGKGFRPTCGVNVEKTEAGGPIAGSGECDYIVATSPIRTIVINTPPVSNPGSNQEISLGDTAYFNGSGSFDPDGEIVSYNWNFADGTTAEGMSVSHNFASVGTYVVTLTVTDNLGATDSNTIEVVVGTPVAEYISIAPENATLTVGSRRAYLATAHDSTGNSWDVTSGTTFGSDGGIFQDNMFTSGQILGTYGISAYYNGLSAHTHVTIIRAEAEKIEITPKNANVSANGVLAYFATAVDSFNNSWDVTTDTNFSSPGGIFIGNLFGAGAEAGTFEVAGTYEGLLGTTVVNVLPGAPVSLLIAPKNVTLSPLGAQAYTATAEDAFGNKWDATPKTVFSSDGGSFSGNALIAGTTPGEYSVVGNYSGVSDTGNLRIVPGYLVSLELSPANATIAAGASRPYTAKAYDEYGNPVDVTGSTAFSSEGGNFTGNIFSAGTAPGDFAVVGVYGEGEGRLTDSALVRIISTRAISISISPKSTSIISGGTQSYTATAFDQFENSWDVTYSAAYISEAGTFNANVLTSDGTIGTFQVVGEYENLTDYANITVNEKPPGPTEHNVGGSSFGFSGGSSYTPPVPPIKACQKIGEECGATTDCCEGICTSGTCKIPEEKPTGKRLVEVMAPGQANVGENVTVLLRYMDNGDPVPGASIQVISPSYEIIQRITNEAGTMNYVPLEEGWHDYLVPNYDVWGVTSTYASGNASESGRITIIRYLTRTGVTTSRSVETSPISGLFLGRLAPELIGLLLLVFLLLGYGGYLYYKEQQEPPIQIDVEPLVPMNKIRVRKPKKPPEAPPEPAQPGQPQNPT